jgi:chromosome segregation ATPase
VVATLWTAAWAAAQREVLGRLERVSAERDSARQRADMLAADLAATTQVADQAEAAASAAAQAQTAAEQALAAAQEQAQARLAAAVHAQAAAEQALAATQADAARAAELAIAHWHIERTTLQAQIERLEGRVAELRALEIFAAGRPPEAQPRG